MGIPIDHHLCSFPSMSSMSMSTPPGFHCAQTCSPPHSRPVRQAGTWILVPDTAR